MCLCVEDRGISVKKKINKYYAIIYANVRIHKHVAVLKRCARYKIAFMRLHYIMIVHVLFQLYYNMRVYS